jgi:hypothetical protein
VRVVSYLTAHGYSSIFSAAFCGVGGSFIDGGVAQVARAAVS